ncbi:hypothetical protein BaRGS_00019799 [Batillaria attramentaria]|uniref:IPT/TIG domain-containing protein n=1 Tax=Batillaria attramentaria TaxID=370345 RepID=A0ABD0KQJ3_9CAEN
MSFQFGEDSDSEEDARTYTSKLSRYRSQQVTPKLPATMASKYNGELIIRSVNKSLGTARGGDAVFLLCEKVDKDDVQVRLFEEENGEVVWESYGEFGPLDVHRQYAIVFKTPKYKDVYITKPVRVNLQLVRPSDGETSDPVLFTYMPEVFDFGFSEAESDFSESSIDGSSSPSSSTQQGAGKHVDVKEYNGELIIRSVNKRLGTARGGDEVFLLCEKVDKDDIEVRLFEEENGEVVWESYGEFRRSDIHRKYAIVFKTPKYKDENITKPVRVNLQLVRPSDGETSDPVLFTYMPVVSGQPIKDLVIRTVNKNVGTARGGDEVVMSCEAVAKASPDLSDSDPSVPQPVFCDRWEACEEFGSDGGLLHCDDSDVVLEIPENSIKASQQISIRAAVSTDLQTIHKRLDVSEDEMIMSPVPEFDAGDNFEFEKPVVVILPHFIPTVDRPDMLNVYKFHLYDSDILHFEKLRQAPVHESITKQEAHCGVFVLSTPQTIHIMTSHFTGFFCTLCNKQVVPRPLRLRLYGRHIQRDTQEVDIWLFVGDTRLDIRDFRKAVLRRKDEVHFLTNQSIDPWSDDSEDVKLGVRLVISESERAQWQHREIGGRVLPAERKVNVKQFRPCNICSDPCPTKVTWSVVSSPGSFPSRWFNSFIEAGFCRSEGAAVQFLVGHGQNCLDIIGLELQNEKKSATSQTEIVSEKSHVTVLASTSPPSSQTKLQWATEFPSVKQQKATSAGEQATPGNQAQGGYQPLTSHASSSTRTDTDENTLPHFQELDAERYTQTTTYPAGNVAAMSSEGNGEQGGVNELGLPAPTSSATDYHSAEARHMTPEGSGTHDPSTSCNSLVDIFIPKARRQGSGSQGPSVYTFHAHINKFYHTNNSSVTMPTNKAQTVTFNVSSNPPDRNEGGDGQTERKSLSDTALPVSLDPVSSGSTPSLLPQQNSNSFEQSVTEKPEKAHHQAAKSSAVEKQEDGSNPSTSKDGQGGEEAVGPASSVFKLSQGKLETMKDDKGELGVEPTGSCSPANKKSVLELPARATKNGKPLLACLVAEEFVEGGVGRGDSKSAKQKEHGLLGYLVGEDFVEVGVGCISTKQEEREHDTSKMPEVGDAVSENTSVLPTPPGNHSKSRLTRKSSKNGLKGAARESSSPPLNGNTEGDQPTPVLRASQKLRERNTKGKDETSLTKDQESRDHTRSMRSRGNGVPDNPRKRSNDVGVTYGKKPRFSKVCYYQICRLCVAAQYNLLLYVLYAKTLPSQSSLTEAPVKACKEVVRPV